MRLLAATVSFLAICAVSTAMASVAHATNSTIITVVCTGSTGSSVTITHPTNDSTINTPVFTMTGSVSAATQLEVRIDGVYSSTIPIGAFQNQFSVPLTLTPGTHTLTVIANDICAVHNAEATAVVTYQPSLVPSSGANTVTNTGATATSGTITIDGSSLVETPKKTGGVIIMPQGSANVEGSGFIPKRLVDEAAPKAPSPIVPVIVATPFVAGAGAAAFWWRGKWWRFWK